MNDLVEGRRISGDILLDGVDIYKDKMDVNVLRKRVGMVFQKPNPFPMSIYDNIAYGPRTHGVRSKAQLDEIVEKKPARRCHLGRSEGPPEQKARWACPATSSSVCALPAPWRWSRKFC